MLGETEQHVTLTLIVGRRPEDADRIMGGCAGHSRVVPLSAPHDDRAVKGGAPRP
jgi:hypothetical protein